jgi:hypothetical protein
MNLANFFGPDEQLLKYDRVIPRDFFNESKLLKCMGRVALLILDGHAPLQMSFKDSGKSFDIRQLSGDGGLVVVNYPVKIKGKTFFFATAYNSKSNYPLYMHSSYQDDHTVVPVLDSEGEFTQDFLNFCENI